MPLEHDDLGARPLGDGRFVGLGAALGEGEARHHVRHPDERRAEDLAADALAVGLVGEGEDGVGVGVVDEARGEERVEERLDARRGGARVEQVRAELVDHVLVGHRGERA